ncbi:MAG: ABC transporter substrate-binding protein [Phycisphaerae bacterium]|nr:ABC transporter substrate-binding protein [Phycisphaerae bacterium]
MKRRTILFWIVLIPICLLSSLAAAERKFILVGCPLPLGATYGQNPYRGIILATEEINKQGGVTLDGKKYPLKLEIIDTGDLDPKVSESEAMAKVESLITDKNCEVLVGGPNRSEYGLAAMDVIARHNVVHIVCSGCYTPKWHKEKFASDPKKYRRSFRMSGNIAWYIQETRDLLKFLKDKYGFKKMFILIQDVLMCRDAAEIVRKVALEDGWEVVGQAAAPDGTTDFQPFLEKCKKSGAQLLFMWNYSPNTSYLFEQWREMEIPALPMGYVEAAEDPEFWKKTKGKCAYSVITLSEAGVTLSDVTPLSRAFYNLYKKRWGIPPRSTGSAAGYEAMFVLKDAVERANSLDAEKLIPVLEKTDLPVVRGQLRFDENHQFIMGYDPKTSALGNWAQWQNGQRITIWPPVAKAGDLKMPPWLQWWWLKTR